MARAGLSTRSTVVALQTATAVRRGRRCTWVAAVSAGVALGAVAHVPTAQRPAPSPGAAPTDVRFARDVRPILADRCFQCHGPDAAKRKADLKLFDRDSAIASRDGHAAIVPGRPDDSDAWRRINSTDPDEQMPPPAAKKKPLSADEKAILRRWIEQGAHYEPHWAFVPPRRPTPPDVRDPAWCRNEIDRFVLARLEALGVTPSPPADQPTLLRRLFLDLTGLPPTPQELDAFERDVADLAYERWVDRLLGEEPYRSRTAEHLCASWLDAARYADTCGLHTDNGRQMWLWRDWVLVALRDNLPFDRFLTEQLAGDLMPNASTAQHIASGFNRNHVTTDEGGAIPDEYLVEYAVDRLNTTATVFLGLTVGCARCHDHKYDPISQQDYYSLLAFFNSIDEPGLYSQTPDANRAYEPFLEVPRHAEQDELARIAQESAALDRRMQQPFPGENPQRDAFVAERQRRAGLAWSLPSVVAAVSTDPGVTLTPHPDGSIQAAGPMPAHEDYVIELHSRDAAARLLLLEALATPGAGPGAGRAPHGNAVLSGLTLETRPRNAQAAWRSVAIRWAWADHAQANRNFEPGNVILAGDKLGWAFDGNERAGPHWLLLLTHEPFGHAGGADLRVTLSFRSEYPQHSLGRIRFRTSPINDAGIALLPPALGRWYVVGPFPAATPHAAFETPFGPENLASIDPEFNFGAGNQYWTFSDRLTDAQIVPLADNVNATYVGRTVWSPDARTLNVSLGSDDGFRLFLNAAEAASNQVDRGAHPDQDRAALRLRPGPNALVLKIVNTGGPGAYYFNAPPVDQHLNGDLVAALLPADALSPGHAEAFAVAWRRAHNPDYRQAADRRAALESRRAAIVAAVPRTMVMKERQLPRETFVLTRGLYDHPDRSRPAPRAVPARLGRWPAQAPKNRLGLAQWLTAAENPLVARVAVNRFWRLAFGAGLVRTPEDFGLQGEWPSHPELLDWLAVEFRESGWNVRRLLRMIVTSATYRQASRVRPDLRDTDPDNRLLASYPRRRLTAEQIRDLALYVAGLYVERFGGPSVKPYQPDGLWQEVAMPASNTRVYERGAGDDLWRRSLYTYWKRACPPPSLAAFDAPTREACVITRPSTNTPLQALALMNDTQFVEAARAFALRTLREPGDDSTRLARMFRRCTGRAPEPAEFETLARALHAFRQRFAAAPQDADAFVRTGAAAVPEDLHRPDGAAWTCVASAILNLHETITQD